MRPKCKFVKADGSSCGATAMPTGYCWFHSPDLAEQRDAARKRGAQATRRSRAKIVLPPDTMDDLALTNVEEVTAALADTFNRVRKGEMDVRIGNCLGQLAGTLLRAFRGEQELTLTVKPSSPEPTTLTAEMRQRLLAQVRAQQNVSPFAPPALILKELPPAPMGAAANGEMVME